MKWIDGALSRFIEKITSMFQYFNYHKPTIMFDELKNGQSQNSVITTAD